MREVRCKLCSNNIKFDEVSQHLVSCLYSNERLVIEISANKKSNRFCKYFIVAYILDLVSKFNNTVNVREKDLFDFSFSIYEHFYQNALGKCICSPLLLVDDFCRAVISQTTDPNNKYLNIIPSLMFGDFMDNQIIANLSLIFSRSQWLDLKARNGN